MLFLAYMICITIFVSLLFIFSASCNFFIDFFLYIIFLTHELSTFMKFGTMAQNLIINFFVSFQVVLLLLHIHTVILHVV